MFIVKEHAALNIYFFLKKKNTVIFNLSNFRLLHILNNNYCFYVVNILCNNQLLLASSAILCRYVTDKLKVCMNMFNGENKILINLYDFRPLHILDNV